MSAGFKKLFAGNPVGWQLRLYVVFVALSAIGAAVWAYTSWRSHVVAFDDAWISYRYAYNLVHGHGVVYNPGERVEGYTNPLWVMITAAFMAVGAEPLAAMRAVGIGSHLLLVGVVAGLCAWWVRQAPRRFLALLCFAPLLILPSGLLQVAGSGLETSFFALGTVVLGVVLHVPLPKHRWILVLARLMPAILIPKCQRRMRQLPLET